MTVAGLLALDAEGGERLAFGDVTILVRVPAEVSGGSFTLLEEVPPLADTPLHVTPERGRAVLRARGRARLPGRRGRTSRGAGGLVFAPRGVPHSQRRVVSGHGRELVLFTPGGFEGFFRELAAAQAAGSLGPDAYAAASERFGVTWLP